MRAGNKNRRVRIEVLATNKSTFGTDVETWSLLREVWAEITYLPLKAQEAHQADEIISEMFVNFKIDYIATISPKGNRMVYQGQIYDIWHVAEVGYREALMLKTRIQNIAGIGSGVGISGSAQQSSPPTLPQLTRMGNYNVAAQANETVTVVDYSAYQFTIDGINKIATTSGTITLTVNVDGLPVTGLTNIAITSTPQNLLATGGNIVPVGSQVDFVFTNAANALGLKFTMKSSIK